jgi:hypothetical protein
MGQLPTPDVHFFISSWPTNKNGDMVTFHVVTVVQVWHRQMQDIQKLRVNLDISVAKLWDSCDITCWFSTGL